MVKLYTCQICGTLTLPKYSNELCEKCHIEINGSWFQKLIYKYKQKKKMSNLAGHPPLKILS